MVPAMKSMIKIGAMVVLSAISVEGGAHLGASTCACLGSKDKFYCTANVTTNCIQKVSCNVSWKDADDMCVHVTSPSVYTTSYPSDYGDSCKKHNEVGSPSCYNQTFNPPVELATSKQAGWCADPWCYVDECNCDASDAEYSHWFKPVKIPYSYSTCGSSDKFTSVVAASLGKLDLSGCPTTTTTAGATTTTAATGAGATTTTAAAGSASNATTVAAGAATGATATTAKADSSATTAAGSDVSSAFRFSAVASAAVLIMLVAVNA